MLFYACLILLLTRASEIAAYSRNINWAEEISECAQEGNIDVNNLGFHILNKAITYPGNVFLSPASLAWSLAILYGLSTNQTAESISKLLAKSGESAVDPSVVEEEISDLLQRLKNTDSNFDLSSQFLLKNGHKISDDFKRAFMKINISDLNHVSTIWDNQLNEEKRGSTEHHAENSTSSFSEHPNIEIRNFITFNDSWKIQFLPNHTERDYFYSGKRETTQVWMMTLEAETFKFLEDFEMRYKVLELPYENEDRSMILVLPTQYDQPADLQLDAESYCTIKSKLIPTKLDLVSIPRFHFNEENSLKQLLTSVGLEHLFNETQPGIGDAEAYVSDIKQTVSIEVDEDGGETTSNIQLKFKPVAFRGVKEFIANHPFLFYVEDRRTGTILLSGRIDEPSESVSFSEKLHFSK